MPEADDCSAGEMLACECSLHSLFACEKPDHTHCNICMRRPAASMLRHVCLSPAGAKKREEIYTAFENIYPTLKEYKKREAAEAAGLGPLAAKASGGCCCLAAIVVCMLLKHVTPAADGQLTGDVVDRTGDAGRRRACC